MVKKKQRTWPFLLGMALYAAVFLGAAWWGLGQLSAFLDAFERSRPQFPIDSYMAQLTPEYIADKSQDLIAGIDHNLQSEADCRKVIIQTVSGKLSCAKKIAECTEDKQVFVIRCGAKVIGTMEMERQSNIGFGFTPWAVSGDSFDLRYLISDTVSVTVPNSYSVFVNGIPLDSRYVTQTNIPIPQLSEFAQEFRLPYLVSYQAGPVLGDIRMTVQDENGMPGQGDLEPVKYLKNCTEAEEQALHTITEQFLTAYMRFSTRKNNDTPGNYNELCKYMVKNGELADRMKKAFDGLTWVSDRKATFNGYEIAFVTRMDESHFLVDVTYTVTTNTIAGAETESSRVQLIMQSTSEGLKAEIMRIL